MQRLSAAPLGRPKCNELDGMPSIGHLCAFMKVNAWRKVTRRCPSVSAAIARLDYAPVRAPGVLSQRRTSMLIAPSDDVVIPPADVRRATTHLPGSTLSRRYAIGITLQTKGASVSRRLGRNPICTSKASTSPLVLSRIAAAQGQAVGPSGKPRTGGATAYRAASNFRCWHVADPWQRLT